MEKIFKRCAEQCLTRPALIRFLVSRILDLSISGYASVIGIDGIDLSGKTTLAGELEIALEKVGTRVVVIHGDDFLNPKSVRYRQGEWSTIGFYEDFFDFTSLACNILLPLRQGYTVDFPMRRVNLLSDEYESSVHYRIDSSHIVLVEGLFLLRPELAHCFDLIVRLKISSSLVMERALVRDVPTIGNENYVRKGYELQSIPAQTLYEASCQPDIKADIIIDNSISDQPLIAECRTDTHYIVEGEPHEKI